MINSADFPRLTEQNHRVTSPEATQYNCVAWAANDIEHWWQPGVYWPITASIHQCGLDILEQLFVSLGFERSADGMFEKGFQKVALYGDSLVYTHAARQTDQGMWASKLGSGEDIEHESAEDVAGGVYGSVAIYMKKQNVEAN